MMPYQKKLRTHFLWKWKRQKLIYEQYVETIAEATTIAQVCDATKAL